MTRAPLRISIREHVAVVGIERTEPLDSLDASAIQETRKALASLDADAGVRCIFLVWPDERPTVVRSAAALPGETMSVLMARVRDFNALLLDLAALPKPTVSAIAGDLTGVACNLALACDFRVAAEGASLGQSYVKAGLPPHGGASYLWPEMAGLGRANEVLLGGAILDTLRAQRYRLVTQVVPAVELEAAALRLAAEMAGAAPVAVALAKALAQTRQRDELEAQLEAESYALVSALLSGA